MKLALALLALSGAAFAQADGTPVDPATGEVTLQFVAGRFIISVTADNPELYGDPLTIDVDPLNPPTGPIIIPLKQRTYKIVGKALSVAGVPAQGVRVYDAEGRYKRTQPVAADDGSWSYVATKGTYIFEPVWADMTVRAEPVTREVSVVLGPGEAIVFVGKPTSARVTLRLVGPDALPAQGTITVEAVQ